MFGQEYELDSTVTSYFADFNGDTVADILVQANDSGEESYIIYGAIVGEKVKFLASNKLMLTATIDGNLWSAEAANIVTADVNGDDISDVTLFFKDVSQAYTYFGSKNGIELAGTPSFQYTEQQLPWLANNSDYDAYSGDFNGDGFVDVLTISQEKQPHILMQSNREGQLSVAQIIKKNVKWGKNKAEKLIIKDINNDGKDDVFALANEKEKFHYQMLTDESGFIGKAKKIKNKLKEKYWNNNDFRVITADANNDNLLDLIRLNNMPGGIDENGDEVASEEHADVDDINDDCDQLFYSANGSEGTTCVPWNQATAKEKGARNVSLAMAKSNAEYCLNPYSHNTSIDSEQLLIGDGCETLPPPSTPTSYPSVVGGSYHPIGSTITVSLQAVPLADYYQVFISTYDGGYKLAKTTFNTSASVTVRSTYGYNYIKYSACRFESSCSGLSPYRRIYAYTAPGTPSYLNSNDYSVGTGQGYNLTFAASGGSADGAKYYLQESFDGGDYSTVCTKTRSTWREQSYTCPIAGKSTAGTYRYRVYACNPKNVGCGGTRYSSNVVVTMPVPGPPASFTASPSTLPYGGTTTLNWSKPSNYSGSVYYNIYTKKPGKNRWRWKYNLTSTSIPRGPLNLSGTHDFDIEACNSSGVCGPTKSLSVIVLLPTVATPVISPNGGSHNDSVNVSISTSTNDAIIYYSTDGSPPSTVYTGTFTLTSSKNVKTLAKKTGYNNSAQKSASFTIKQPLVATIDLFEWQPSTVEVGKPATFYWETTNINKCYAPFTQTLERASSGRSGPHVYDKPATKTTKWYCEDIYGNRIPETGYLEATLTIVQGNTTPVISGSPSTSATVGQVYSFTPNAVDADNDTLTFSIINKPAWASFNVRTGEIFGKPQAADVATYSNVVIAVTDGIVAQPVELSPFTLEVMSAVPARKILYIHTDMLGTPVAETNDKGDVQ